MVIVNCGGNAIDFAIKTLNNVSLKGTGNVSLSDIGAQETLVSGTNIKSINSSSILGSGNINLQTPLVAGTDYQTPLVSGTSIKTVNSTSLLGSGDVAVQEVLVSGTNIKTVNGNSLLGSGDLSLSDLGTRLKTASLTLATTDWSATTGGYSCTKTISDMTTTALIIFPEVEGYPTMKCSAQASGSITIFCAEQPSASVSVNVAYSIGGLE